MKLLLFLLLSVPMFLHAQETGIKWTTGLSWKQVQEKAKRENKYIFLDCFTTWCGPCKLMDKNIYSNDSVGNYFNNHFVSVRVQMDKTPDDDAQVQSWYNDAQIIGKKFRVEGYPSLIFFSPNGQIVQKELGYRSVSQLISNGETATISGKVYEDPYSEYNTLVKEYNEGVIHYNRLTYMLQTAFKFQEFGLAKQLLKDHIDYMLTLRPKSRYTKENIELWSSRSIKLSSNSQLFGFFYHDGKRIDKAMGAKGYATHVIDNIIFDEIVEPFLIDQATGSGIAMKGMVLTGPDIEANHAEADWSKLYAQIKSKYNDYYAKRIVLSAKAEWYSRHKNYNGLIESSVQKFQDCTDYEVSRLAARINNVAWEVFLRVKSRDTLIISSKWMKKVVQQYPTVSFYADTYANLLYKIGRRSEAIKWEETAISQDKGPSVDGFKETLEKMKKGEPTYVEEGAVWETNKKLSN